MGDPRHTFPAMQDWTVVRVGCVRRASDTRHVHLTIRDVHLQNYALTAIRFSCKYSYKNHAPSFVLLPPRPQTIFSGLVTWDKRTLEACWSRRATRSRWPVHMMNAVSVVALCSSP